jgi:hypothetical protein
MRCRNHCVRLKPRAIIGFNPRTGFCAFFQRGFDQSQCCPIEHELLLSEGGKARRIAIDTTDFRGSNHLAGKLIPNFFLRLQPRVVRLAHALNLHQQLIVSTLNYSIREIVSHPLLPRLSSERRAPTNPRISASRDSHLFRISRLRDVKGHVKIPFQDPLNQRLGKTQIAKPLFKGK